MKFTFNINIEKKHIFLLALIFSIAFAAFVFATIDSQIAQWNDISHTTWHNANDTKVKIGNVYYSLQTLINEGWLVNKDQLNSAITAAIAAIPAGGGGGGVTTTEERELLEFTTPYAKHSLHATEEERTKKYFVSVCPAIINGERVNFAYLADSKDITDLNLNEVNSYDVNASNLQLGRSYDFVCSYGKWDSVENIQGHRISLSSNYQLIAEGKEPPVSGVDNNAPIILNTDMRDMTKWKGYGWYVAYRDGKLKFQVKTFDNQCPTYNVGVLFWQTEVFSWSGINCTIYGQGIPAPAT